MTEPAYPVRVAAIDVGSNALRMVVAAVQQARHFTVLEQIRSPVRLGRGVFRSGVLDSAAMDAAIVTLRAYRERIEALDVAHYRAVATSAVREAGNGDPFVARVAEEAGIVLEPITGAEEARLVHLAVRSRIDLGAGRWLLVDLGGGSVEVSIADRRRVRWSVSHGLGAVRLLEELAVEGDDLTRFRHRLEEYVAGLSVPGRGALSGFVATGGNAEALARMTAAPAGDHDVYRVPLRRLRDAIETMAALTPAERVTELGMRPDRADVILPAALVYERLCVRSGLDVLLVPQVGVREGLVLDLADDLVQHERHARRQDEVVWGGAHALGRRYHFDRPHARQVTRLALSLFDQLWQLHGLGEADRRMLTAAGLLHDIGAFVAYKKHHKHSLYLIAHAELPGLSPVEIVMVANIARYHRKSHPADHHEWYMQLNAVDRQRVAKLASLLRIADALDREHAQRVRAVDARVAHGQLALRLDGDSALLLERWALQRKARMFEEVFGLSVAVDESLHA